MNLLLCIKVNIFCLTIYVPYVGGRPAIAFLNGCYTLKWFDGYVFLKDVDMSNFLTAQKNKLSLVD